MQNPEQEDKNQSNLTDKRSNVKRQKRIKILLLIGLFFLLGALAPIGITTTLRMSRPTGLPTALIDAVEGFTPYYFTNSPPAQFMLKEGSASYSSGILVFSVMNNLGQTVAISQQAVPSEMADSQPRGDETLSTSYGSAALSTIEDGRTTGSLKTKDGTLIFLNTKDPVEISTIKDILRTLSPAN